MDFVYGNDKCTETQKPSNLALGILVVFFIISTVSRLMALAVILQFPEKKISALLVWFVLLCINGIGYGVWYEHHKHCNSWIGFFKSIAIGFAVLGLGEVCIATGLTQREGVYTKQQMNNEWMH
jgi:hypothetical protein